MSVAAALLAKYGLKLKTLHQTLTLTLTLTLTRSEKRLFQLNFLFDKVGGALKAAEPP